MFETVQSDDLVYSNSINENTDDYLPILNKEKIPDSYDREPEIPKSISTKSKIKLLEFYLSELRYQDLINELALLNYQPNREQEPASKTDNLINSNQLPFFSSSHFRTPVDKRADKAILYKKRMRNMNDRKRPGWELAYGRRKRSIRI